VGRLLHSETGFDCVQCSAAFCSERRKKGRKWTASVKLIYFSSQPLSNAEVTTLCYSGTTQSLVLVYRRDGWHRIDQMPETSAALRTSDLLTTSYFLLIVQRKVFTEGRTDLSMKRLIQPGRSKCNGCEATYLIFSPT